MKTTTLRKKGLLSLGALLFALGAQAVDYEVMIDDIRYRLNSDTRTAEVIYTGMFSPMDNSYSGDVVIPASVTDEGTTYAVTSVGDWAFYGCPELRSVTMPGSITTIGEQAFSYCTGLATLSIPSSVTSIGEAAFRDCTDLTGLSVQSENTKYDSRNDCNAIIETGTHTLIAGCKNTVIPNTVTSIGRDAFSGRANLTEISIPESVTSIGENAFLRCTGLTAVSFPSSVTNIGNYAFEYCSGLTAVTLSPALTSIGGYAFHDCSGLTTVTIPGSVTSIGDGAFYSCSNLASVYMESPQPPSTGNYPFDNVHSSCIIYVPTGCSQAYGQYPWNEFTVKEYEVQTGIDHMETAAPDAPAAVARYDLLGHRVDVSAKGIQVVRYSDGTARKVLVK